MVFFLFGKEMFCTGNMRIRPAIIKESLHRLKSILLESDLSQKYADGEPPLSSGLFSNEQMEQHGKTLAATHILGPKVVPDQDLLSRLAENEAYCWKCTILYQKQ